MTHLHAPLAVPCRSTPTAASWRWRPVALALVLGASGLMTGCAPLILGGVMGGSMVVASDRRTPGTQVEDQTIELKAGARVRDVMGEREGVSAVSYNRVVLLVGNAPSEADKAAVEQAVSRIPNVRSVVNELSAQGVNFTSGFNDSVLTSKVKATLFDAKDLQVSAFKVVSNRGVVYLMGRVTEREANRAAALTRSISGVQKVVRVFEIVTDAELIEMQPGRAPGTAPAPG
ncbi:MAG: BON domain-containing protein [Pseudomonadota bacterium]